MTFAELIIQGRKSLNLTRSELARRLGITPQYAMNIERGFAIPSEDKIERLIELLDLDEKTTFKLADKIPQRVYEQAKKEYFKGDN